jgi:hypothetical protein
VERRRGRGNHARPKRHAVGLIVAPAVRQSRAQSGIIPSHPHPMPTLRFEGYSDDTFGEYAHTNNDYDNCASGESIEFLVEDPSTGFALIVTGQHCPGNSFGWLIGVSNGNTKLPFPSWPMKFQPQKFQPQEEPFFADPCLVIEAPDGVLLRCLTREVAAIHHQ